MISVLRAASVRRALPLALLTLTLLCAQLRPARSQTYNVLHSFDSYPQGVGPAGNLVLGQDGAYYGVTSGGGDYHDGLVFRFSPSGDYTTLYNFTGSNDGGSPSLLIAGRGNVFYGAAGAVLFSVTPDGELIPLVQADSTVVALVLGTDGQLYGLTENGGVNGNGSVFRLRPADRKYTILYSFSTDGAHDGSYPIVLTQGSDGSLCGASAYGGTQGYGTLFRINTTGAGFGVLHNFSTNDDTPTTLITGPNSMLYGATVDGGVYFSGTLFSVKTNGHGFTILHSFNFNDGDAPQSLVFGSNGALYGVTADGGRNGVGTVFTIHPDGSHFTTRHSFDDTDGDYPNGLTLDASGSFYGTTLTGGGSERGTIFKMGQGGTFQTVYTLAGTSDGAYPIDIAQGRHGSLFGVTADGGTYNEGTIFQQIPGGPTITLHNFNYSVEGGYPANAPIEGRDGNLYGTLTYGGVNGTGIVYQLTAAGQFTILHSFGPYDFLTGGNPDGLYPSTLAQTKDGTLYGTAFAGGPQGYGTIFTIMPDGQNFNVLYSFSGIYGYGDPDGPLIVGRDGDLYGTTTDYYYNPSVDYGTIFKITPTGTLTTVYTFWNYTAAANPVGALVQATDGKLYGVCAKTGPDYYTASGSLFSINPNGTGFKNLYVFTGGPDGAIASPYVGLLGLSTGYSTHYLQIGTDGRIYGIAPYGGANYNGTLYSVGKDGSGFTVLDSFANLALGAVPQALVPGSKGSFYGVTTYGGDKGIGALFQFAP